MALAFAVRMWTEIDVNCFGVSNVGANQAEKVGHKDFVGDCAGQEGSAAEELVFAHHVEKLCALEGHQVHKY